MIVGVNNRLNHSLQGRSRTNSCGLPLSPAHLELTPGTVAQVLVVEEDQFGCGGSVADAMEWAATIGARMKGSLRLKVDLLQWGTSMSPIGGASLRVFFGRRRCSVRRPFLRGGSLSIPIARQRPLELHPLALLIHGVPVEALG